MVHDPARIERTRLFILQVQHQLDSLEFRITDFTLREDYLQAARSCLDQARDVLKMSESKGTTATQRRQALLAAETMLAVCNRQIRLLLVKLLDIHGPGVLSLASARGLPKSSS